jgi:hypothetical protein
MRLNREAKNIQDKLLQELFVIRRDLELSLVNENDLPVNKGKAWLEKIAAFHHTIEQLNRQLLLSFPEENLSLAIQYLLISQRITSPSLNLQLELPPTWNQDSPKRSRVILTILDELFWITLPPKAAVLQRVSLKSKGRTGKLEVEVMYPNQFVLDAVIRSKDLKYLRQSFQLLASGKCSTHLHQHPLSITWRLQWRLNRS